MPGEVNPNTYHPQTGRPETNIGPQSFTPNQYPSAPMYFESPPSNNYTGTSDRESPDPKVTISSRSVYYSISHLNEEVAQLQNTQLQSNQNTPQDQTAQLSKSVKSISQTCVGRQHRQTKKGKCASDQCKLVTLGPSGAGKTATVHSLLGKADISCTSTKDTVDCLYTCEWKLIELPEYTKELAAHYDSELKREKKS